MEVKPTTGNVHVSIVDMIILYTMLSTHDVITLFTMSSTHDMITTMFSFILILRSH